MSYLFFMKLLRLFGYLIKHLTYFKKKLLEDNSMSRKPRWGMVENPKNSMWAKLIVVRMDFSKFEFLHDLHCRYFHYQQNIFNTIEIRRSWHVDKLLDCKLVYTNEMNNNLKSESQIFANSRVTLVKHYCNILIMFMGLSKSCIKDMATEFS
jgi:inactivated superfamily I helicase